MTAATATAPVRRSVTVAVPVERAFRVFTEDIGDWWPLRQYSVGEQRAEGVTMGAGEGGRIVERIAGGDEAIWGEVLAWEPPHRVLFTWHPGADPGPGSTEIEVCFTHQDGGTLVELEHRGWERMGDRTTEIRPQYEAGWQAVLDRYAEAANGTR